MDSVTIVVYESAISNSIVFAPFKENYAVHIYTITCKHMLVVLESTEQFGSYIYLFELRYYIVFLVTFARYFTSSADFISACFDEIHTWHI